MIGLVKQQLDAMRVQEQAIRDELARLNEQLIATQGAVQVLAHVIATYEAGEGNTSPVQENEDRTDAKQ